MTRAAASLTKAFAVCASVKRPAISSGVPGVAGFAVTWSSSITLVAAVGVPVSPTLIVGVLSVGLLIGWISQVVPMGLGLQDGGNYALFGILGATGPQGLLVAMLQRARSVSVAMLGLGVFVVMQILGKLEQARIQKKIRELRGAT